MNKLRKILLGVFAFFAAVSLWGYLDTSKNATAANSLLGNNEVITIKTTDGQPLNNTITFINHSGDGNIVFFASGASNLPDYNSYSGLYTYNLKTDTTERIDVSTSGVPANGAPFSKYYSQIQMSENGRFITFGSNATNLIDGVTKAPKYIYKRDTQLHTTIAVGLWSSSSYSHQWDRNLGVSNDGRFSLVASQRILNASYPYPYKIALGEDASDTYSWKELANGGGNNGDISPDSVVGELSCDGAFAAFQIQDTIKLTDLRSGSVVTVSAGGSNSTSPMISCNGRYILYATRNRTDVTPAATGLNSTYHLIRYDRLNGEYRYVDTNSSDTISIGKDHSTMNDAKPNLFGASIADTGDVVVSYNNYTYLKHLSDGSGTLEPIARSVTGSTINVDNGSITKDGRYIFFQADPYSLGIGTSPAGTQIIRTKTNL